MDQSHRISRATAVAGFAITASVLALLTTFLLYQRAETRLEDAYEQKHESYLLADELRQSSDDLTRLARTFVVTGKPLFAEMYQDVSYDRVWVMR
jgi:CHASE3 domain sensor protein